MKTGKSFDSLILTVRDQKVMQDADLAELYGVETRVLNQAVKRNADRFPEDFVFPLTMREWAALRSQIVISKTQDADAEPDERSLRGGRRVPPYAFTEHGALMAANVLNSPEAAAMSIYVVRAFIQQREILLAQTDVLKRLAQMDAKLLRHDAALRTIWRELQPLLAPPAASPKPQIGFHQK